MAASLSSRRATSAPLFPPTLRPLCLQIFFSVATESLELWKIGSENRVDLQHGRSQRTTRGGTCYGHLLEVCRQRAHGEMAQRPTARHWRREASTRSAWGQRRVPWSLSPPALDLSTRSKCQRQVGWGKESLPGLYLAALGPRVADVGKKDCCRRKGSITSMVYSEDILGRFARSLLCRAPFSHCSRDRTSPDRPNSAVLKPCWC